MGLLQAIFDPGGFFTGNSGSDNAGTAPNNNDSSIAMANASRDAQIVQSNNMLQAAQIQAATMQLGILKSSQDAQFQTLAWLTERLDANDTKLKIAVENAKIAFRQQSDRHVENMEQLKLDARQMEIDEADRARAGAVSTDAFMA